MTLRAVLAWPLWGLCVIFMGVACVFHKLAEYVQVGRRGQSWMAFLMDWKSGV